MSRHSNQENPMRADQLSGTYKSRFSITVTGAAYHGGSSHPWRGGTYTAEVVAESRAEAIIEVLDGLSKHGKIRAEGGDTDWTAFDDERELTITVAGLEERDA